MAAAQLLARGPRATELTKMLSNAADGEAHERVQVSLAGSIAAATDELAEELAAFRARRPAGFAPRDRAGRRRAQPLAAPSRPSMPAPQREAAARLA